MNKQHQFDKKQLLNNDDDGDDDEQIEKTLNFFDAILDPYLTDQDKIEDNNTPIPDNSTISNHTTSSSSSSSSLSSRYIPPPQFRQRLEQKSQVRRYTSYNNLNEIPSSSSPTKSKSSYLRPLQTTATSTENLSIIPSHNHLSNFIKKTNLLSSNSTSASLIDLSSIDKLSSKRPHYRFIPPSNGNHILKEEPEIEQQFQLKTISSDQKLFNNQIKSSHKIVKPTVIIPSVPKSAPMNRLIETNIHHLNEHSAFKPHRSNKIALSQIKRTDSIQKSNINIGITNSHIHQQQSIPQFHQSMLNLSSPEPIKKIRYEPRISYQSKQVYPSSSSRTIIPEESTSKRSLPTNNPSIINNLHHTYPYSSFISSNTGISSSTNNHRPPTYYNPKNIHKYQSSQYSNPIPSVVSRNNLYPLSSSSNIYNFNQNNSPRDQQLRHNYHRQNVKITTYL